MYASVCLGHDNPNRKGITTLMPIPQPTRQPEMLPRYQQEMTDFAHFW